jgi:hypothetical protein
VPEAAIDKDRNARSWEADVCLASQAWEHFLMESVPKAAAMQRRSQSDFSGRLTPGLTLHAQARLV